MRDKFARLETLKNHGALMTLQVDLAIRRERALGPARR